MPSPIKKYSPLAPPEDIVKEIDRLVRSLSEEMETLRREIATLSERVAQLEAEQ